MGGVGGVDGVDGVDFVRWCGFLLDFVRLF